MQTPIRCMLMRGGTSKGAYFLAEDLPSDQVERDCVLLSVMGSPDPRQVDGLGGAHPLTSKVAIVSRAATPGADIDFLFAQVGVAKAMVDTTPNCGNILAGVGPFAIERGLVRAGDKTTRVRVRTLNTGTIADLLIETPGGRVNYGGAARIDGVPGTAAPIAIDFLDAEGSVCGALLPTGRTRDIVEGVPCTLIDNGMPVIVLKAADVGRTGHEPRDQLDADRELKQRLEGIRLAAGPLMNLGDVTAKVVPKLCLLSAPRAGGHVATRSFIPHE
ncbi:MAG: 4-oxalomesaconate tautomerase, partial [Hyphomicrobiaceae bacterium]